MWRSYDAALVRAELGVLRQHGLGMTRSFFYWPDFMPAPDRIDETMAGRFAGFLDLHAEAGMTTVPTFIVGHMSGENWDPPWRAGREWLKRGCTGRSQLRRRRARVSTRVIAVPAIHDR